MDEAVVERVNPADNVVGEDRAQLARVIGADHADREPILATPGREALDERGLVLEEVRQSPGRAEVEVVDLRAEHVVQPAPRPCELELGAGGAGDHRQVAGIATRRPPTGMFPLDERHRHALAREMVRGRRADVATAHDYDGFSLHLMQPLSS